MIEKEYLVQGEWINPDDFACHYCGQTIEENGGYMAEIYGDWVCATNSDNAQCWWEVVESYAGQIIDLESMERDDEVREAKDEQ